MRYAGGCFCGAVSFTIDGELGDLVTCYCRDCQRLHGNTNAVVWVEKSALRIRGAHALTWFQTSAQSRRSFCSVCGSRMFKDKNATHMLVGAGVFEPPLAKATSRTLFDEDKPAWQG